VKPDLPKAMLVVATIQNTGASNWIEGIYTSEARLTELVKEKAGVTKLNPDKWALSKKNLMV